MDEPQAPAFEQDSPPQDPAQPTQETVDWQKRAMDNQAWGTKTAQELAAARAEQERLNDTAYQRELMASWGYEVEDPDPGYTDPTDDLRAKLAELESWKDGLTQREQEQQQLATIESSVDEQFKAAAPDLDPATREWVTTRALNMDPRDDGMPDIQGALKAFQDWEVERQKQWRAQKRKAPHIPSGGAEGTQAPNLDERQARIDHMAARLAAMDDD
jgi:hypothetical protein